MQGTKWISNIFSLQYKDNEFGFGDLDSSIQLAFRKPNILMVKTDPPVNEEVNDTVLATSNVEDKKKSVSFGTLVSVDSENSVNIIFIVIIYLFCLF